MAPHSPLDHPALRLLHENVSLLDADGRIVGTTLDSESSDDDTDVWNGASVFDFIDPRDVVDLRTAWDGFVRNAGASVTCEVRLRTTEGLPQRVEVDLENALDDPVWNAIVAVTRNVTPVRAAEEQLVHQHELIDKIGRGATDDALFEIAGQLVRHVARARVAVTSVDEAGERHVEVARGLGAEAVDRLLHAATSAPDEGPGRLIVRAATSPRTGREVGAVIVLLDDDRELLAHEERFIEGAVKFTANVMEQRKQQERLAYTARYDELTDTLDRTHLLDRMATALRRRDQSVTVLLLDVDRFRRVNDAYGHEIGDQLLRAFAGRVRRLLDADDVFARLGDDEFAVLIVQRRATDAAEVVAERVTTALREPFTIAGHDLRITASIGIARMSSDECDTPDLLLATSGAALAESKRRGRGVTTVFDRDDNAQVLWHMQRESDLRQALRSDQLVLHFQPIYALDDSSLVGVETLVRWQHPTQGPLLPHAFLPLAEDADLIEELGAHVLDRAVAHAARWRDDALLPRSFVLTVNVGAGQITTGRCAELVDDVLGRHDWPASSLVLELTEDTLLVDCDVARRQLEKLARSGVKVAIDDFGTGYSSLSYVHRLDVDALKLDRSLVSSIGRTAQANAVAKAVATLADGLGITSIVEGVETEQQLATARALGFDWVQGELLSPALDETALRAHLRR